MDALVARADNTNLVAAIDSAKELNGEDYLPDSWTAVVNALAEAEAVAANPDASAEEIETARANLEKAVLALVARADMTALNDAIAKVEAMDQNSYTAASWKLVAEKLEAAKTVASNPNASQQTVDTAVLNLQAVVAALEKAGDTTELNTLIQETKKMDLSKYTTDSAAAIRQAVSDAEAAVAGRASAEDLKAALDALKKAVDSASTKPITPSTAKPATPTAKPDEHPDIAQGIQNGTWGGAPTATPNSGAGSAAASNGNAVNTVPQTSDNLPFAMLVILACVAAGGLGVVLYAKKRSKDR